MKTFIPCLALLATVTTAAAQNQTTKPEPANDWEASFRRCTIQKTFAHNRPINMGGDDATSYGESEEVWVQNNAAIVTLSLEDVLRLQKDLPTLKKCTAFWQCVADRDAGKVKHCYENDRRWR
jgi:hypothetical protein